MAEAKVFVSNTDAERKVLGAIIGDTTEELFPIASETLTPDMFYVPMHGRIFRAISEMRNAGEKVDLVTLYQHIEGNRKKNEAEITPYNLADVSSELGWYAFQENCAVIYDCWQRRQLYIIGNDLINAGNDLFGDTQEIMQKAVERIGLLNEDTRAEIASLGNALGELSETIEKNREGVRSGTPTGMHRFDEKGGLQPSDLILIGAEFSQGKTSLALDIAINAAEAGHPVAFYSMEMPQKQLAARMIATKTGIPVSTLLYNPLTSDQTMLYQQASKRIASLPIYFDERSTTTVNRIMSSIRTMKRRYGIKGAFVDFLQILSTNEKVQNLEQFYGETARKFKNLAKEIGIFIVLLTQISRSKDTTEPTTSRIRGSGQIPEAADVIFLIYRPEVYGKRYKGEFADVDPQGTAQITIAKGKNIGQCSYIMRYDAPTTHFYEPNGLPQLPAGASGGMDDDEPF